MAMVVVVAAEGLRAALDGVVVAVVVVACAFRVKVGVGAVPFPLQSSTQEAGGWGCPPAPVRTSPCGTGREVLVVRVSRRTAATSM